jgi:hypothetical protein
MPAPTRPAARPAAARRPALALLPLDDRLAPALLFAFDYSLDTAGFFHDPAARAALERAAADLGAEIATAPAAIAPAGGDTWTAVFAHPSAPGTQARRDNLLVPANTQYVFAGGIPDSRGEAGLGGYGGYTASGSRAWMDAVKTRGQTGFAAWGGSVSFDVRQSWYFGADPAARPAGQLDFYSVAVHELTHALGFGTAPQFTARVSGDRFAGANATAANGGVAPALAPDRAHWAQGTRSDGDPVSMQPTMEADRRVGVSRLDLAALADLGWQLAAPAAAPVATVSQASTGSSPAVAAPAVTTPLPAGAAVTGVSGAADGTAQVYTAAADGTLTPAGGPLTPFPGFAGAVRSAVADVTGDGVPDLAFGTGPGGGSRVRVLDGRTRADVVPEFSAFERSFAGGVFLAAGDFDRDGRADLVVTPDQGGGPRVRVLSVNPAGPQTVADFFGIDDPNFRGGARTAVGDVDADGTPDLIVAAGFGGGPRVAVFDGRTVPGDRAKGRLAADFFAFETTLRNGVYVSAGDVDGDGAADLVIGAGPGGGPRVLTVSGRTLLAQGGAAAVARPLGDQFVGDPADRGGVRVAVKDLAGGRAAEVVAGSGTGGEVRVLRPAAAAAPAAAGLSLPAAGLTDGVYVG